MKRGTQLVAPSVVAMIVGAVLVTLIWQELDRRQAPPILIERIDEMAPIVVSVEGAVATPGVYTLPGMARVDDAIAAAGGFTQNGDQSSINRAERLIDGQRVTVLFRDSPNVTRSPNLTSGQDATAPSALPEPPEVNTSWSLVNVNTATRAELETLPGIGPALAERIIEYRTQHGPFGAVDDLERVSGVGPSTVDRIRPMVTV